MSSKRTGNISPPFLSAFFGIPFVFFGIGINFVDFNGREFFYVQALAAVIANLVRIKVADLALHTSVAFLLVVENTHLLFHAYKYIPFREKKQELFIKNRKFFRTNVCNFTESVL